MTVVVLYVVLRWDTGEVERMSPWDLQPVTEHGKYLENVPSFQTRPLSSLKLLVILLFPSPECRFFSLGAIRFFQS